MAVLHGIQPVEIVHRDLKAANVLLGEADGGGSVAKVADFGLAKTMETFQSTVRGQTRTRNGGAGTLAWKAPETFKGNYSRKSDVFGFAMIVYETVCRKPPFNGQAEPEILAKLNEANMFKVGTCKPHAGRIAGWAIAAIVFWMGCVSACCLRPKFIKRDKVAVADDEEELNDDE